MLNEALDLDYEIIGGEKFRAPMAAPTHSAIIMCLSARIFDYVVMKKNAYVFTDNIDVHLPDGNLFRPDLVVVTNENAKIVDWKKGIYGVPDMVVEVLSPSTRQKDLTIKKDIYESNGVREYWIIDPYIKAVDVYLLQDGKYKLAESYVKYSDFDFENLTDEEKAAVKNEVKVLIFDDLFVNLDDIFSWGY